jgi:hypothetical protein
MHMANQMRFSAIEKVIIVIFTNCGVAAAESTFCTLLLRRPVESAIFGLCENESESRKKWATGNKRNVI